MPEEPTTDPPPVGETPDEADRSVRSVDDERLSGHAAALRLLWGASEPPRRGPKPKLSLHQIVQAAISVADAEGPAAVSMRRVAKQLEVGTMSLYRYVPDKDGLLDLMFDAACGEGTRSVEDIPGGWRAKLEWSARETWRLYRRHPWMLQASASRPAMGPNVLIGYEAELAMIADIGLTAREMVAVTNLVDSYVRGVAHAGAVAATVERESGLTDEQWWAAMEPVLTDVADWESFPVNAQVTEAGGYDKDGTMPFGDFSFEFGLQRILDGIEALVERRENTDPGER